VEDLALQLIAAIDVGAVLTKGLNILSVVLGLGLVIFFHELGHFAVAKWCNVHVERFSIGIGPILWSRQKGETEYALSALPFGGYVKMLGQDDMDPNQMTSSEIAENPRSYSAKSVPQRMAIISAGVTMNVFTGFLFFTTCYWFGVYEPSPVVGAVLSGSPAWVAGISAGDRITGINGESIRSFSDVMEAVILSSGDVTVTGVRSDGTPFEETLTPLKSSPGRSIGLRNATTTQMADQIDKPDLISDAGLPLEQASEPFLPGDKIVAITPGPKVTREPAEKGTEASPEAFAETLSVLETKDFAALKSVTARYADRELIYTVERKITGQDGSTPAAVRSVDIRVPPSEVRSLGLWMAMGPIRAIQKNSLAAKAGIREGDKISSVDGLKPGKDIDPLQLPVYFGQRAGQPVKVVVTRATAEGGEEVELELVPADKPGWLDSPETKTSPLTIPSIGLGFQVQLRIAKVLPGSEAARLGVFAEGMKITKVQLVHPKPESEEPDAFGDKESPLLDLSTLEKKQTGTIDDINWAWAFAEIQRAPNRNLRLYFDDGKKSGSEVLTQNESATGWFRWFRGFNGGIWLDERELQKGDSLGEAFTLGIRRTRKTAITIYMTLRQLFRGDVAMDSLSGPLGIAKIGYMVAERGVIDLLMFLGFLSINLAILNFLPIPILDGGHMVFLLWEGITRRKPSPRVINWAHAAGLLFIISLFVFVMYIDLFVSTLGG
jgi:regulator of sigma E protease